MLISLIEALVITCVSRAGGEEKAELVHKRQVSIILVAIVNMADNIYCTESQTLFGRATENSADGVRFTTTTKTL